MKVFNVSSDDKALGMTTFPYHKFALIITPIGTKSIHVEIMQHLDTVKYYYCAVHHYMILHMAKTEAKYASEVYIHKTHPISRPH